MKSSTIRVIISIAVMNKWTLRWIDISNAFLNGHLIEAVYIELPASFIDLNKPIHICKLHKALNGLKQALKTLYDKLKVV